MPFEKGQSGNPGGRPAGRQAFADRAEQYLNFTIDELYAMASDRERFGKLSVYDGMIVRRMIAALAKGGGSDMDRLLDRIMGKPTNTVELAAPRDSYAALVREACEIAKDRRKAEAHTPESNGTRS